MFTRTAVLTALTLTVAACGGGEASLETPTQLQVTTTAPAPTTVAPTTTTVVIETSSPPTTLTPEQIAEQAQLEIDMYHDWVDEQRMIYGKCGEWHDTAIEVGWPEDQWPTLSRVIYRESRCQPDAWNGADSGLTQINQIHDEWAAQMGLEWPEQFFDARVNLLFAYRLWSSREQAGKCGWTPWSISCD